mmetsp:Transcript_77701/g.251433  ORF Transcript_77701/g.251433 Transcript_77701/m.251433 type:complete len:229 (-) Transcript_77701:161-847(-)
MVEGHALVQEELNLVPGHDVQGYAAHRAQAAQVRPSTIQQVGVLLPRVARERAVGLHELDGGDLRREVLDVLAGAVRARRGRARHRELRAGGQVPQGTTAAHELRDLRVRRASLDGDGADLAALGRLEVEHLVQTGEGDERASSTLRERGEGVAPANQSDRRRGLPHEALQLCERRRHGRRAEEAHVARPVALQALFVASGPTRDRADDLRRCLEDLRPRHGGRVGSK